MVDVTDEADGGGVIGGGGGVDDADVVAPLSSELRSRVTRRTAPTRSLAIRDHDSIRLWASQQAAGPRPLIFSNRLMADIFVSNEFWNTTIFVDIWILNRNSLVYW